jgi:hypothetical protein
MKLAIALLFGVLCYAQAPLVPGLHDTDNRYEAIHTSASGGEALTVQQPANTTYAVQFEVAAIYCSVACTVAISQNGTAATGTALATTALNGSPTSTATAWSASNVGSGTALYIYHVAATTTLTLDLTKFILNRGQGTASNFTITTSGTSLVANEMIQWIER